MRATTPTWMPLQRRLAVCQPDGSVIRIPVHLQNLVQAANHSGPPLQLWCTASYMARNVPFLLIIFGMNGA